MRAAELQSTYLAVASPTRAFLFGCTLRTFFACPRRASRRRRTLASPLLHATPCKEGLSDQAFEWQIEAADRVRNVAPEDAAGVLTSARRLLLVPLNPQFMRARSFTAQHLQTWTHSTPSVVPTPSSFHRVASKQQAAEVPDATAPAALKPKAAPSQGTEEEVNLEDVVPQSLHLALPRRETPGNAVGPPGEGDWSGSCAGHSFSALGDVVEAFGAATGGTATQTIPSSPDLCVPGGRGNLRSGDKINA